MSPNSVETEITRVQRVMAGQGRFFAIADAAQNSALPEALNELETSGCLFDVNSQSDVAAVSPHLIELPPFDAGCKAWRWVLRHGPKLPCVTVLCTTSTFAPLLRSLRALAEVRLPDGDEMFFAFWDPAILGSLVGQTDDTTLHVSGPVLTSAQRGVLLQGLKGWWYWDRSGEMHSISMPASTPPAADAPFTLVQAQVDELVEAGVPDQVRYYIELNQPHLFDGKTAVQRYDFVRACVVAARASGLERTVDFVNYCCASLIYRQSMETDPIIAGLMSRVKRGELEFNEALKAFP